MKRLIVFSIGALLVSGCAKKNFREGKFFAGNKYVSAETLNLGKMTYQEYCFACHGMNGDGKGVAAKGLYPPVRDFKKGIYKFGLVADGELLHDDTLVHILKKGLNGTAMLPWDISDKRADAVVQYIKTFAPDIWEGKDKALGKKIELSADPYGMAHEKSAIEKGKMVYHFTAQCNACHRAYITLDEYNVLAKKAGEDKITTLDEDFYHLKPQDSDYGSQMIPPDFTWHPLRTIDAKSDKAIDEIAYRVAAGVNGVMTAWKDVISDEEIWAVSYYVKSLMELKDHSDRKNLVMKLGQ